MDDHERAKLVHRLNAVETMMAALLLRLGADPVLVTSWRGAAHQGGHNWFEMLGSANELAGWIKDTTPKRRRPE